MMYIWSWLFWWWWWWCLVKCHTWGNIEAPLSFSFSLVMFECVQNLLIKLILFRELKMSATFSWFCRREEFCKTRRQPTWKMLSMNTSCASQVLLFKSIMHALVRNALMRTLVRNMIWCFMHRRYMGKGRARRLMSRWRIGRFFSQMPNTRPTCDKILF